jgi:hypothetical protein
MSCYALVLSGLFLAAPGGAQEGFQRKLETMENRMLYLERQLSEMSKRLERMEKMLAERIQPANGKVANVPPGFAPDVNVWRMLKRGMTEEEVRSLLGEPRQVRFSRGYTYWYYEPRPVTVRPTWMVAQPYAMFAGDGRLAMWDEPSN